VVQAGNEAWAKDKSGHNVVSIPPHLHAGSLEAGRARLGRESFAVGENAHLHSNRSTASTHVTLGKQRWSPEKK